MKKKKNEKRKRGGGGSTHGVKSKKIEMVCVECGGVYLMNSYKHQPTIFTDAIINCKTCLRDTVHRPRDERPESLDPIST